jgi:arylsulfatase A-like enzyme
MTRRAFLTATALATAPLLSATPRKPNVIVIFADDLGYGDLGCFGSPVLRTPNLDGLAAAGVKLTNFYSAAPVCTPSRAALLTGRYPIRSGMVRVLFPGEEFGLPDDEVTIAELLKRAGYKTGCIGKWHLGDLPQYRPNRHGFDHYFGLLYSNDMDEEFHRRKMPYRLALYRNEEILEAPAQQRSLTRRYTDEAIRFIAANHEQPFFLYLAHSFPHWPWFASENFEGKSIQGRYGDTVEELDSSVGQILSALKSSGLDQHTLVLFTSDNGAAARPDAGSNGPFRGAKFSTWEGGMREPFIASWPGQIPPGTTRLDIACTMDLFATIANLAGAALPPQRELDGVDILPLLRGIGKSSRDHFLYFDGPWDSRTRIHAIRSGPWKLHFRRTPADEADVFVASELYNLHEDPGEKRNVLDQHDAVARRLTEEARQRLAAIKPGTPCPPLKT